MDSLSQVVLGASVAGALAPAGHRGKAMLLGAGLGTLPDLDVFIDFGGAVENFTYHRGFSHSLFVLAPFSVLLWLLLRRWWAPVRDEPLRWLAAISLALLTHPLLDAHTAYGTQLFWPLTMPPTSWATLFIIDPLYTLPLLVGVLVAIFRRKAAATALRVGLVISTLYIGWSWAAQTIVARNVEDALASMQLQGSPVFMTPAPLTAVASRFLRNSRTCPRDIFEASAAPSFFRILVAAGSTAGVCAWIPSVATVTNKLNTASASHADVILNLNFFIISSPFHVNIAFYPEKVHGILFDRQHQFPKHR